jgi:hypothetical protein
MWIAEFQWCSKCSTLGRGNQFLRRLDRLLCWSGGGGKGNESPKLKKGLDAHYERDGQRRNENNRYVTLKRMVEFEM